MKPGKLYIKIFLSFLMILVVTEILIFGFFIATVGKAFRDKYEQYTVGKIRIVKQVIEDKIRTGPAGPLDQNIPLKQFIEQFGNFFSAKVWLSAPNGTPLVKSFPGSIPEGLDNLEKIHERDYGDLRIRFGHRKHSEYYGDLPIDIGEGRMGRLHVFFEKTGPPGPEGAFALGLVVLGLIIAVLTIPVSRIITKRIKNLSESANIIAEGNLSHRATVKGRDEIGDLCRAFNRMAEKLEHMIEGGKELTANISHELRTPLARIRIAEQLLTEKLERQDFESLERHLSDIREDIGELDRLIGRILDLSKLDIHDKPLNMEPFDLAGLLEELLERFQPALQQKRITLTKDLAPAPALTGDREALATAISNVLDNAADYTPEGGALTVKITQEEDAVSIDITNTSEALSQADLTRIFEPFYRAEGSRAGGSGLGLAITRKILEKHGGSVEAGNAQDGLMIRMVIPKGDVG